MVESKSMDSPNCIFFLGIDSIWTIGRCLRYIAGCIHTWLVMSWVLILRKLGRCVLVAKSSSNLKMVRLTSWNILICRTKYYIVLGICCLKTFKSLYISHLSSRVVTKSWYKRNGNLHIQACTDLFAKLHGRSYCKKK